MKRRLAMEIALGLIVVGLVVLAVGLVRGGRERGLAGFRGPVASVEFLDVGQGDAILVRSPEGKTALIDAGPSRSVVGLLRARGVTSLDLVVVSHHHSDHYGGMAEVIRAFHPRVFVEADSPHATPLYVALLELVKDQGMTAVRPYSDGPRKLNLGSVVLTLFPQPPSNEHEENNNSIGIRVDFGGFSALLTGDSEGSERRWWLRRASGLCSGVQVLKLAHHGSRNGVDRAWLEATRPALAVASLGSGNDFGHPHPQTLALLRSEGVPLLRTDLSGTVAIRTDGKTWAVDGPGRVARRAPPAEDARVRRAEGTVHLNSATEAELRGLPGVGASWARKIIAGRPYRSVDDLAAIPHFGRKRVETLRPFATAR